METYREKEGSFYIVGVIHRDEKGIKILPYTEEMCIRDRYMSVRKDFFL